MDEHQDEVKNQLPDCLESYTAWQKLWNQKNTLLANQELAAERKKQKNNSPFTVTFASISDALKWVKSHKSEQHIEIKGIHCSEQMSSSGNLMSDLRALGQCNVLKDAGHIQVLCTGSVASVGNAVAILESRMSCRE